MANSQHHASAEISTRSSLIIWLSCELIDIRCDFRGQGRMITVTSDFSLSLSLSLSLLYRGALKGLCRLNVVLTLSPTRVDLSRRLDTLPRILRTRRNLPSDDVERTGLLSKAVSRHPRGRKILARISAICTRVRNLNVRDWNCSCEFSSASSSSKNR
jgi:hypothetical protein